LATGKKYGAKSVQNLAPFQTILEFDRKYLGTDGWIICTIGKTWSRAIPAAFGERSPENFGPLTTTFYMQTLAHPTLAHCYFCC